MRTINAVISNSYRLLNEENKHKRATDLLNFPSETIHLSILYGWYQMKGKKSTHREREGGREEAVIWKL